MKIAITGASGYIGSFLIKELEKDSSCELILLSTRRNDSSFIYTDYSVESLSKLLDGIDVIIHLAAIRKVNSFFDAIENVQLSARVAEASCKCGVKQIILASSISVYSDEKKLPWKEDISEKPETMYGMSKLMSEHSIRIICKDTDTSYTVLRFAHVIGDNMPGTYILPTFFRKASNGEDITVIGKSIARRELVDVIDVCQVVHSCIGNANTYNQIINVGPGSGITNKEVADTIAENCVHTTVNYIDTKDEGIASSYMNNEKLKKLGLIEPSCSKDAIRRICKNIIGR